MAQSGEAMKDQVLVAGAGPVGVTAAYALLRQDIPVTLLEASEDLPSDPRASTFHPPTMEMLDEIGLAEPLHAMGLEVKKWQYRDRKEGLIAEFDLGVLSGLTRYPFRLHCEQYKYARMVLEIIRTMPHCTVHMGAAVNNYTQDADSVSVTTEGPGGVRTFGGRYLIGCDGGRSEVRRCMGTKFDGFTFEERFLVLTTPHDFEPDGFAYTTYLADPDEWVSMFKVPAGGPPGHWRVVFPMGPEATDEEIFGDTAVQARLQAFHPLDPPYEVLHRNLYAVHQRIAETFRQRRVFLAGDAAHINNPLGGMGLNFGIHDALNLGDKLGTVWRSEGDEALLDLYVRQRRTVAVEYLHAQTLQNKRDLEERDPAARAKRQDQWRETAGDPDKALGFLRRTAMFEGVERARSIQ